MATISWSDERAFRELAFKWAMATDTKSLDIFLGILDSEITIDMTDLLPGGTKQRISPTTFFEQSFSEDVLGHPDLQTQHLLGEGLFTRVSETEATGNLQIRANHIRRFKDGRLTQWDASAYQEFAYVKVNDEWKLGGWRPHCVVAVIGNHADVLGKDRTQ